MNKVVTIVVGMHGETEFSREGRLEGSSDSTLTLLGDSQARELSMHFPAVSNIYCAANRRSTAVARIVAAQPESRFKWNATVYPREDLREFDFGPWEGIIPDEQQKRALFLFMRFAKVAGAETDSNVEKRFFQALFEIVNVEPHGAVVGLISSEYILRLLYVELLDMNIELAWKNTLIPTRPLMVKVDLVRGPSVGQGEVCILSILSPGRPFSEGHLDADGSMLHYSTE